MGRFGIFCVFLLLMIVVKDATGSYHYDDDDDDDDDYYSVGKYECTSVRLLSRKAHDASKTVDFRVDKMRVLKEFKDGTSCPRSRFWFKGRKVFAKDGCRADFEVCYDSDDDKHRRHRHFKHKHHHKGWKRHRHGRWRKHRHDRWHKHSHGRWHGHHHGRRNRVTKKIHHHYHHGKDWHDGHHHRPHHKEWNSPKRW